MKNTQTKNYIFDILIIQSGSSTIKNLLIHISGTLDEITVKFYEDVKNLAQLHESHNNEFMMVEEIRISKHPKKALNDIITNDSIFSFLFVRHPYQR